MVEHTYLFEEGTWDAEGIFTDGSGSQLPLEGAVTVSHSAEGWLLSGTMQVQSDPPLEVENHYVVRPIEGEEIETTWTAHNPELGRLEGRFTIIEDSLVSTFSSPDGTLHGTEVLVQVDADSYENRGVLYQEQQLISTWAVSLTRTLPGMLH